MGAKVRIACGISLLLLAVANQAQQASPEPLAILDKQLPPASLWQKYSHRLQASGGIGPYRWIFVSGPLPRSVELRNFGELVGIPEETGSFEFTVLVGDNQNPAQQEKKKFVLNIEKPLTAEWNRAARVDGARIDGSIRVSNHTGRDFDLTFIVLAVNEIGRATAIGYQHFPLKMNTRDLEIPFGETLSPGNYAVNVDVVGEEPISNRIFRARLVTGKQQITPEP
jgi:hypothetical protein